MRGVPLYEPYYNRLEELMLQIRLSNYIKINLNEEWDLCRKAKA